MAFLTYNLTTNEQEADESNVIGDRALSSVIRTLAFTLCASEVKENHPIQAEVVADAAILVRAFSQFYLSPQVM